MAACNEELKKRSIVFLNSSQSRLPEIVITKTDRSYPRHHLHSGSRLGQSVLLWKARIQNKNERFSDGSGSSVFLVTGCRSVPDIQFTLAKITSSPLPIKYTSAKPHAGHVLSPTQGACDWRVLRMVKSNWLVC